MQKVDVQIEPKLYDTKRLYCSQGDTELRKFGIHLMDGDDEVDISDISDPVFQTFPSSVGGTEEILPSSLMNGSVDLGSLTYEYNSNYKVFIGHSVMTDIKETGTYEVPNMTSSIYKAVSWAVGATDPTQDMTVCYLYSANQLRVRNTNYSDANAFKQAMQGGILWYEKSDSTPSTSPIRADIQYPDGLREDEIFTYRECPTTEDGSAKITSLKGNTVAWNQLCNNSFGKSNLDFTLSGNELAFDFTSSTNTNWWQYQIYSNLEYNAVANHVYYVSFWLKSNYAMGNIVFNGDRSVSTGETSGGYTNRYVLFTNATSNTTRFYLRPLNSITANTHYENIYVKNIQIFDLTQMFGTGNEPTIEEFRSLYPLPFYSYNSGTLVNFSGNGIKVTGKNLVQLTDSATRNGITFTNNGDGTVTMNGTATANAQWTIVISPNTLIGGNYYVSGAPYQPNDSVSHMYVWDVTTNSRAKKWDRTTNVGNVYTNTQNSELYVDSTHEYQLTVRVMQGKTVNNLTYQPMIRFADVEDSTFEPYKETITDLPTLAYFPNGLKSAGDVYDELTSTKDIIRVGSITFDGTQTPVSTEFTSTNCRVFYNVPNIKPVTMQYAEVETSLISNYLTCASNSDTYSGKSGIHRRIGGQTQICVSLGVDSGITNITGFNSYLSSKPLTVNYPLVTPLENYGIVDLGTLTWSLGNFGEMYTHVTDIKYGVANVMPNMVCASYPTIIYANRGQYSAPVITIIDNSDVVQIRNTGATDPTAFKNSLSGVYLYYEKADPQSIKTATLVTEVDEIGLYPKDGILVGDCTRYISENAAVLDAKVRISDGDGDCYSNKLKISVEAKP